MILLNISNQPISNLKRKVQIEKLIITDTYVEMNATLLHYANINNEYGDQIPRFNIPFSKNTLGSYIDANTGLYARPINDDAFSPVFEEGVDPVPEMTVLKSTPIWTGILQLLEATIANIDAGDGYERI